jgi:hypothetical protein
MADLGKIASAFTSPSPNLRIRFGKIVSVESDRSVTVTIGGSTDSAAGVKYLASVAPLPGAVCILATDGTDIFVLDHIAADGRTLAPRANRSTDQSINDTTDTAITFDGANSDSWACWDAGSPTRLTAPITGRYMAVGNVQFASNGTGFRSAWIEKTGTATVAKVNQIAAAAGSPTIFQVTTPPFDMTAGTDYLRLLVRQNSGGALLCTNSSTYAPSLSLIYLGS